MENAFVYEQPLNEYVRICLRLEFLFDRIKKHKVAKTEWESAFALSNFVELLSVAERPDLRSRLGKALLRVRDYLNRFSQHPSASVKLDQVKLNTLLAQLERVSKSLHCDQVRVGQSLCKNAFLKSVRYQLATPGGTCYFNAPDYHLWLKQSPTQRQADLDKWLECFNELDEVVRLLLKLTRDSAELVQVKAGGGFYQRTFDPNKAGQMIRVVVPQNTGLYPVFSVGRHRCALHFYRCNFQGLAQPDQYKSDVDFYLAYCVF